MNTVKQLVISCKKREKETGASKASGVFEMAGCKKCCFSFCKALKKIYTFSQDVFTLSGHVPSGIYTTDIKYMFIFAAVYTSLVAQFRQTGNQEAEGDILSGRFFKVNAEWTNHTISGGVSDQILWNCRTDSRTATYYKIIYLGLVVIYFGTALFYFLTRIIMTYIIGKVVSHLQYKKANDRLLFLEAVADDLKYLDQHSDELKKS